MGLITCRSAVWAATVSVAAILTLEAAQAQEQRWVQIEAHRDLDEALSRARQLNAELGNLSGFRLPSEWFALSIGPFESEGDAFAVRRQLRGERAIPADAFVSNGADYLDQIFPEDGSVAMPADPLAALEDESAEDVIGDIALAEPEPEP